MTIRNRRLDAVPLQALDFLGCWLGLALLLVSGAAAEAAPLVTAAVNDTQRVILRGHTHPLAQARFDAGAVPDTLPMELHWVMQHSAEQTAAMNALMEAQQTRGSPSYHQWLTPAQFGSQFGADARDLAVATAWLTSQGFAVRDIPAGRGYITFTGSAAKVTAAFHTPIHYFQADGAKHFANTTDPQIPAAFQSLVAGILGLHDFQPKPGAHARPAVRPAATGSQAQPAVHNGGTQNYVGPTDAAIIYDLAPVYQANLTGSGMKIAVAAQSDIDLSIPTQFWTAFGVNKGQQLSSIAVSSSTDPGRTGGGAELEAYVDTEIIGGLVPNAQIILVRDNSSLNAIMYAVNLNLAPVMNLSFTVCEQSLGAGGNTAIANTYQQAAMQGITVLVASGDAGSAGCESTLQTAGVTVVSGLAVNGLASTPYDTAVGGTDFDGILVNQGHYWNTTNTSGTVSNALSYIPEMVWNQSCGNPVTAYLDTGSDDVVSFCNNAHYSSLDSILGSGGGYSSCISLDNNGNCNGGYAAPFWQASFGDGTRTIPDVSMLANDWVICTETQTCAASGSILIGSGTSAAAPAMASLVLLYDQSRISANDPDGRQGNINPLLYLMGQFQQTALSINSSLNCNADSGASASSFCIFHDIQTGDNDQPCSLSTFAPGGSSPASSCYTKGNKYGLLTNSSGSEYTFVAAPGFDLVSGLGSVNANNFIFTNLSLLETASLGTGTSYADGGYPNYTVWRPSTGYWYTLDAKGAVYAHQFGASSDMPVVGDFDGDRFSDIAVWRPSTGYWYITQSSNNQVIAQQWGASTDIPVAGDFDGDGRTDIAVWRPSTGYWYIKQSVDSQVYTKQFGESTDMPVVGDFDGDGKSDIAVFRPSTGYWYILQSSTNQVVAKQWGASTDIPVVGDFDGDGKSDIAVYRPSTGYWYIIQSHNGQVISTHWGASGDIPVSRDYDGDGLTDIAVWRPSTGYWYVIESSNGQTLATQFGASSDIPINKSQIEH